MKKLWLIIGGIVLVSLAAFFVVKEKSGLQVLGVTPYDFPHYETTVVGQKTATTTIGAGFYVPVNVTSTFVTKIGAIKSIALYTVMPTAATTTGGGSGLRMTVEGSNDDFCDTSATSCSEGDNCVLTKDIKWTDAANHLPNIAQTTTFANASSSVMYAWGNPMPGVSREILLKDLNFECLRLGLRASSTELYVGLRTK
jgi:hypothetical protein